MIKSMLGSEFQRRGMRVKNECRYLTLYECPCLIFRCLDDLEVVVDIEM